MSSVIWLYIWILVKAYLQVGLFMSSIILIMTIINDTVDRTWFRDFLFTLFLHPIIVYYLIKELTDGE
jgi:hypothetical protein